MIIRRAEYKDTLDLMGLMNEYIMDFYQQATPDQQDLKGLIELLLEDPSKGLQFVAEQDGKLIGFATLYFTFSTLKVKRAAILNDLFVKPEVRGQKVGEMLFKAALDYIRQNDFSSMTWETAKDNIVAQSLYHKMGGQLSEWLVYEIK